MSARVLSSEMAGFEGKRVRVEGWVHRIRDLGGVRFLSVRDRSGLAQVVVPGEIDISGVGCECVIRVDGISRSEPRAPGGVEVLASRVDVVARAELPPLEVYKPLSVSRPRLDTLLDNRAVSLRIPEVLDIFRVQAEIVKCFRSYLDSQDFVEINTPKLVLAGAEGGAALFEVDYFEQTAYLAQSPQFYKQIMVGSGLERVYEVGHAYRAEKSETSRHITEFVSLDFEIGFIEDEQDLMQMLSEVIRYMFSEVRRVCAAELERMEVTLPQLTEIPQISYLEAETLLREKFGKSEGINGDLDTEGERLIGEWAAKEHGNEFVFVTGYAMEKRPVYALAHEEFPEYSRSFDLLYRGVEIVTGGQRIHDYGQLVVALRNAGLDPTDYRGYLAAFKYGMPPHGGMGMGLERLTKQMLGLSNIKEACLFPRDRYRLTP